MGLPRKLKTVTRSQVDLAGGLAHSVVEIASLVRAVKVVIRGSVS